MENVRDIIWEKYRDIFENTYANVLAYGMDATILIINDPFLKLVGYNSEEVINKNFKDFLFKDDIYKAYIIDETPIEHGKPEDRHVYRVKKKDGAYIYLEALRIHLKRNGKTYAALLIGNDVTNLKIAENMLKKSEENYRKAYERENFYKDLFAHDMKNILQSMLISLELSSQKLKEVEIYEELKPFLNEINDQIKRGASLVKNVETFSKLEEGERKLELKNLSDSLNEAIKIAKNYTDQKTVNVTIKSPKNNIFVQADEFLIDVFENILINAIKHNVNTIVEILINVSVIKEKEISYLKIEIRDNGMGIPDSKKESIFNRIHEENRSTSGMGLGLSLVKKILNVYNAKICVENMIPEDSSKGSKFIILFPREAFLVGKNSCS